MKTSSCGVAGLVLLALILSMNLTIAGDTDDGDLQLDVITSVPRTMTYQGIMKDDMGDPVEGVLTVSFSIYDASSAGTVLWSEVHDVEFTNGLFTANLGTVTPLDLAFDIDYFMEIMVGGETLSPRQPVNMVGYAARADTADYAYAAPGGSSSLWSVSDSILSTNSYWGLARGGAANVLYGDSSFTHVNLGNASTTGEDGNSSPYITISGGIGNVASSHYSSIGGGKDNTSSQWYATIGGGIQNIASGTYSTVAGGRQNNATNLYSTVAGGRGNFATGEYSIIGGGLFNFATNQFATICGGESNEVSGERSAILGGFENLIESHNSAILGGWRNEITSGADYSYLFGRSSTLTQANTFMVDTDHIRFGDESSGYEFPTTDGTADQVLVTDGSGQLGWANPAGFPSGGIIMWSGALADIPSGWALCDGSNGTPNLTDRFIYGVGTGEDPGASGGTTMHSHYTDIAMFYSSMGSLPAIPVDAGSIIVQHQNHQHEIDPPNTPSTTENHLPPYYKLAFIMKL